MAEVEALVRSRAEDLINNSLDDDSSSLSSGSSCFSPRSVSSPSSSSSSVTDDLDWSPKSTAQYSTDSNGAVGNALKMKCKQMLKRKPRLNRRSVEDRQSRKKEQNKNAANRYRLKKKAEIEILLDEEKDLIKRNEQLGSEFSDVCREAKYLKSLLRELYKAKGLIA